MLKIAGLLFAALLIVCQEARSEESLVYQELKPLEIFVGTWEGKSKLPEDTPDSDLLGKLAGKKLTIQLTARWSSGKSALIEESSYTIEGVDTIKGVSILAWDQGNGRICSHSFTTHKGTWEGVWIKKGDKWVHEFEGTNLDGEKVVGRWEVVFDSDNHYVLKESRTVDGDPRSAITWEFRRLK